MCNCREKIQLIINILTILSTFTASMMALVIALFGKRIDRIMNQPKISSWLRDSSGELTQNQRGEKTRFFHIVFQNKGIDMANNSIPMLKKIEKVVGDKRIDLWSGSDVPLNWQFGNTNNMYKNIGRHQAVNADFVSIAENGLSLQTWLFPNNMPPNETPGLWRPNTQVNIVLTVYLKYDQGISKDICIQIQWDGIWDVDAKEMSKHFQIFEV